MKRKQPFNCDLDFKHIDFRQQPQLYRVGIGEQGVLLVEPYKSAILPHWRFATETLARLSAEKIYTLFQAYLQADDFVGADMARKFLQMGFTRARRYANHQSGRKYGRDRQLLPQQDDALINEKARSAAVFRAYWFRAKDDPLYLDQKKAFTIQYMDQLQNGG